MICEQTFTQRFCVFVGREGSSVLVPVEVGLWSRVHTPVCPSASPCRGFDGVSQGSCEVPLIQLIASGSACSSSSRRFFRGSGGGVRSLLQVLLRPGGLWLR